LLVVTINLGPETMLTVTKLGIAPFWSVTPMNGVAGHVLGVIVMLGSVITSCCGFG
jgi:hypothetical protein